MDILKNIWAAPEGGDEAGLHCCHCNEAIKRDHVLARTIVIRQYGLELTRSPAKEIGVPWVSAKVLLYNRHGTCLTNCQTKYVAISHVWHKGVAKVQLPQGTSTDRQTLEDVARIVREIPVRVYQGIVKSGKLPNNQPLEVWHDYLSFPQWLPSRKRRITQAIPDIFQHAFFVVPYMSDLQPSSVRSMRQGSTTEERIRGITQVCNAVWYRRMWTAMECIQSRRLRPMLADYELAAPHPNLSKSDKTGYLFIREARLHFHDELVRHTGTPGWGAGAEVHDRLCEIAEVGRNILPFMLGPLRPVRDCRLQGKPIPFAQCFIILSRRQVTVPRDFVHALIGLTGPVKDAWELPMGNPHRAAVMVARACMERGDLSPLFMLPWQRDPGTIQESGFDEFGMFGLVLQESGPDDPKVVISEDGNAILSADNLGMVKFATRLPRESNLAVFHDIARLILQFTGPDPDVFAETAACRFYGEYPESLRQNMERTDRKGQLKQRLDELQNENADVRRDDLTNAVASMLRLDTPHEGSIESEKALPPIDHSKVFPSAPVTYQGSCGPILRRYQ